MRILPRRGRLEENLSKIVEFLPPTITTPDRKIVDPASHNRALGFKNGELVGIDTLELVNPRVRTVQARTYYPTILKGEPVAFLSESLSPDGSFVPVVVEITPRTKRSGTIELFEVRHGHRPSFRQCLRCQHRPRCGGLCLRRCFKTYRF